MALERNPILPVGFYSVDLPNRLVADFRRWQQNRSAVKVLKTNDNGNFSWILFQVTAPTLWTKGLGFPTIAKQTDERPAAFIPTKDVLDQFSDGLPKPSDVKWLMWGGAALIAWLLWRDVHRPLAKG